METPQELKPRKGVNIIWVLVLMLASFSGGVFVGLNPSRIPASIGLPSNGAGTESETPHAPLITTPTTQPMSSTAQTQPSTMP
jgi:hypothetical protein